MSARARRIAAVFAGLGVLAVIVSPLILLWWGGSSGSIGDLREIEFLAPALGVALGVSVLAGYVMERALRLPENDPAMGRNDPWAAYFVGLAVLSLGLTLIPALGLLILLPDENAPLGSRVTLFELMWVGGTVLVVVLSFVAGRAVLRRRATQVAAS